MKILLFLTGFLAMLINPAWIATPLADPIDFVDQGNYFTDTIGDLDWLKLTETTNLSYNQVNGQLGSGGVYEGWRYATSTDLIGMLSDWAGTSLTLDTTVGFHTFPSGTSQDLFNLLGITYLFSDNISTQTVSEGLLADTEGPDSHHFANIALETYFNSSFELFSYEIYSGHTSNDSSSDGYGSYLIRESVTAIPLPASLWVFGAGMLSLAFMGKRKATNSS